MIIALGKWPIPQPAIFLQLNDRAAVGRRSFPKNAGMTFEFAVTPILNL